MVKLVIIDDDPLVRAGLGFILGADPELELVAEGADGDEAVGLVKQFTPDVVLMDIRMPRIDGLSATRQVLALPDAPRIIVLTTFEADDYVMSALRAGASGFLLKDTPPEMILQAIRQVAAGEHSLSPTVLDKVIATATTNTADARQSAARQELARLTQREREVAIAVAAGMSNAQIARSLFLSVGAVKAQVGRIFTRLGFTSRIHIAMLVRDAQLEMDEKTNS